MTRLCCLDPKHALRLAAAVLMLAGAVFAAPLAAAGEGSVAATAPVHPAPVTVRVIHVPDAAAATPPAGLTDLRVVRDPETGALRAPTPQEAAAMDAADPQSGLRTTEGLESVTRPDGTILLDLAGRFLSVSLARGADDHREEICVDSIETAEDFLLGAPAAAACRPGAREVNDVR